jgi:hypothetical protein
MSTISSSNLGDSCTHVFIATSRIFCYYLIIIYVLFGVLFIYLFTIAYFRSLSLGANDFGNLQELDFQDFEQQPTGEQGKWPLAILFQYAISLVYTLVYML